MRKFLQEITTIYPSTKVFNLALLVFRILISLELMISHGLRKIGFGIQKAEMMNDYFVIAANLFFPVFIIAGLLTRLAALPILAITLADYFVVYWNGSQPDKDILFYVQRCLFTLVCYRAGGSTQLTISSTKNYNNKNRTR